MALGGAVEIPDQRASGRFLRVSWHRKRGVVVISQWRDGVCVATTPVELTQVPRIVRLLVQALGDALSEPETGDEPTVESLRRDAAIVARRWLRRLHGPDGSGWVAPVVPLRRRASGERDPTRPLP